MNIYPMLSGVEFTFTNDKRQFHLWKYFAFLWENAAKVLHFTLFSGLRRALAAICQIKFHTIEVRCGI